MRKILTLSVLLLALTLYGTPLLAKEYTGTMQQIKKSGTLKIGYRKAQPPISFVDQKGSPAGYSIDLGQAIAKEIGQELGREINIVYLPVDSSNRFQALNDGSIDLLCGATTKTLSRMEKVDFTQLTFVTGAAFLVPQGSNIANHFDGKKLGVVRSTTTENHLQAMLKKTGVKADVVLMKNSEEGLKKLKSGAIDAFAADQVVLIGLALSSDNPGEFQILPNLFSFEPFALALRRNDADLKLAADRALSRLYRSKNILKIYEKWFGQFAKPTSAYRAMIMLNATPE
jgi:ABC-type amino acid transport substrate-binding protein